MVDSSIATNSFDIAVVESSIVVDFDTIVFGFGSGIDALDLNLGHAFCSI